MGRRQQWHMKLIPILTTMIFMETTTKFQHEDFVVKTVLSYKRKNKNTHGYLSILDHLGLNELLAAQTSQPTHIRSLREERTIIIKIGGDVRDLLSLQSLSSRQHIVFGMYMEGSRLEHSVLHIKMG